ncbi:hypothetical protein ACLBW2_03515 [Enterobacteriaceae bacterium C23F]
MKTEIKGGIDIALKVPPHQYQQTIAFYRNTLGLEEKGVVRCDAVEPLPEGFKGGWIMSPCGIVHMVREEGEW